MTKIAHRRRAVDNLKIFYREAGRSNAPAVLLLHHRAFDAGLIRIVPESTAVLVPKTGLDHSLLNITRLSLEHLTNKPHPHALALRWKLYVEQRQTPEVFLTEPHALTG